MNENDRKMKTTRDQISLYYLPDTNEGKKLLGYAMGQGVPVKAIDISKSPLTATQLLHFSSRLGIHIREMINTEHHGMPAPSNAETSAEEWAVVLRQNPEVLRYPIAERGDKVTLIHTPSDILQL